MMNYYAKMHREEKRLFVRTPDEKEITTKLRETAPCRWNRKSVAL
jgi:hypothetical protein